MKFAGIFAALCAAPAAFAWDSYYVTYDNTYDNPSGSTNSVACSNLEPEYPLFDDFPDFPYIGGAFDVVYDSPNCGSCWQLSYNGSSIYLLTIDAAANGFNIAEKAFVALGGSIAAGHLEATAEQVDGSYCGL